MSIKNRLSRKVRLSQSLPIRTSLRCQRSAAYGRCSGKLGPFVRIMAREQKALGQCLPHLRYARASGLRSYCSVGRHLCLRSIPRPCSYRRVALFFTSRCVLQDVLMVFFYCPVHSARCIADIINCPVRSDRCIADVFLPGAFGRVCRRRSKPPALQVCERQRSRLGSERARQLRAVRCVFRQSGSVLPTHLPEHKPGHKQVTHLPEHKPGH